LCFKKRFITNLKVIELYSYNEQAFTFWLNHYSKFRLILLFYDYISACGAI